MCNLSPFSSETTLHVAMTELPSQ